MFYKSISLSKNDLFLSYFIFKIPAASSQRYVENYLATKWMIAGLAINSIFFQSAFGKELFAWRANQWSLVAIGDDTSLFHSSQQLPRLCLEPLKSF